MTRSDNIKEFLKYASPRLEYINHCMEKQALKPAKMLPVIRRYADRLKALRDGAPAIGAETRGVSNYRKSHGSADAILRRVTDGTMDLDGISDEAILKGITDHIGARKDYDYGQLHKKLFTSEGTKYENFLRGLDPKNDLGKAAYLSRFKKDLLANPEIVSEAAKIGVTPEEFVRKLTAYYSSAFRGTPGENARGLRKLFSELTPAKGSAASDSAAITQARGIMDSVGDWTKEHPIATPAIAAGSAAAAAGGIGYGMGSSSGYDDAMENAHAYYTLRERFREDALREANSSVASRLANVFGAGDLNALLSGNL